MLNGLPGSFPCLLRLCSASQKALRNVWYFALCARMWGRRMIVSGYGQVLAFLWLGHVQYIPQCTPYTNTARPHIVVKRIPDHHKDIGIPLVEQNHKGDGCDVLRDLRDLCPWLYALHTDYTVWKIRHEVDRSLEGHLLMKEFKYAVQTRPFTL